MSRFWDWAVETYARPGAAEACLALQDEHGQSVPFLLWAAWAALQGRRPPAGTLEAAADLCARWEALAAAPLRTARRGLKAGVPGIDDGARERLRAEVKALELEAEHILMLRLEALSPPAGEASLPLPEALFAAAAAWTSPAPRAALERLAHTLS